MEEKEDENEEDENENKNKKWMYIEKLGIDWYVNENLSFLFSFFSFMLWNL